MDTYCAATHRNLTLLADSRRFVPCCSWTSTTVFDLPESDPDPLNHQIMHDIRQQLDNGVAHPGCKVCHLNESTNNKSLRQTFNEIWGRPTDVNLKHLELNLGNLCNLKCRMCGSYSSSKWIADEEKMGKHPSALVRRTLANINLDFANIQRLKLIGGEITLEQETVRNILLHAKAAAGSLDHLIINLVTNGTMPFSSEIMSLIGECKRVTVEVSIDGIGSVNDYQRSHAVWDIIADTARYYHSMVDNKFRLHILSTVTAYNIHGIPDLIDWVATDLPLATHHVAPAYSPQQLTIRNLPQSYKDLMVALFKNRIPVGNLKEIDALIRYMLYDADCSLDDVKQRMQLLDSLNEQQLQEFIPVLYQHMFG